MAIREVFWVKDHPPGHLAIVLRPRGGDWLPHEMLRLRRGGVGTVVSLLEPREAEELGLAAEALEAHKAGLQFLSYPIPDVHVPESGESFRMFVAELAGRLSAGAAIGVHCRACIGRSVVMVACTLIHLGWNPKTALATIAAARGCEVPDTAEQKEWILHYRAQP